LQEALPTNTAVVDFLTYTYFQHDKEKPGREGQKRTPSYVAFVITRDKISRVELNEAAPINKAVHLWREGIQKSKRVPADLAQDVRDLVWAKVRAELPPNIKTVYIAPDMDLTAVPWAAVPGDKEKTILLEDFAVAVIPHAHFLLDHLWPEDAAPKRPNGLL